ncbi:MAG: hypothetical protein K6G10_04545 [Butyrivibrio sp.]|nr:hypothetical protein [Butyrivibrio sp.]
MNIDAMSAKRDMRFFVEAAMAVSKDTDQNDPPSAIVSSISFSSMLENAIKLELLKGKVV